MTGKTLFVSPLAPMPAPAAAAGKRAFTGSGLRLGILDNSKANADHLLALLVEGMRAYTPIASVVSRRKPTSARPADPQVLDDLAREADFIISAMAD